MRRSARGADRGGARASLTVFAGMSSAVMGPTAVAVAVATTGAAAGAALAFLALGAVVSSSCTLAGGFRARAPLRGGMVA